MIGMATSFHSRYPNSLSHLQQSMSASVSVFDIWSAQRRRRQGFNRASVEEEEEEEEGKGIVRAGDDDYDDVISENSGHDGDDRGDVRPRDNGGDVKDVESCLTEISESNDPNKGIGVKPNSVPREGEFQLVVEENGEEGFELTNILH